MHQLPSAPAAHILWPPCPPPAVQVPALMVGCCFAVGLEGATARAAVLVATLPVSAGAAQAATCGGRWEDSWGSCSLSNAKRQPSCMPRSEPNSALLLPPHPAPPCSCLCAEQDLQCGAGHCGYALGRWQSRRWQTAALERAHGHLALSGWCSHPFLSTAPPASCSCKRVFGQPAGAAHHDQLAGIHGRSWPVPGSGCQGAARRLLMNRVSALALRANQRLSPLLTHWGGRSGAATLRRWRAALALLFACLVLCLLNCTPLSQCTCLCPAQHCVFSHPSPLHVRTIVH